GVGQDTNIDGRSLITGDRRLQIAGLRVNVRIEVLGFGDEPILTWAERHFEFPARATSDGCYQSPGTNRVNLDLCRKRRQEIKGVFKTVNREHFKLPNHGRALNTGPG